MYQTQPKDVSSFDLSKLYEQNVFGKDPKDSTISHHLSSLQISIAIQDKCPTSNDSISSKFEKLFEE